MTTHTAERLEMEHRANNYPGRATVEDIAAALEGRRLMDPRYPARVDPRCRRCEQKNRKRQSFGVDRVDESLYGGDTVTLHAVHMDDGFHQPHWSITSLEHVEHPQPAFEDVETEGTPLVRAHAELVVVENRYFVTDVKVTHHSPAAIGPEQSAVDREFEEFEIDDDDTPEGVTRLDIPAAEPHPDWPDEEADWVAELVDDHGAEVNY